MNWIGAILQCKIYWKNPLFFLFSFFILPTIHIIAILKTSIYSVTTSNWSAMTHLFYYQIQLKIYNLLVYFQIIFLSPIYKKRTENKIKFFYLKTYTWSILLCLYFFFFFFFIAVSSFAYFRIHIIAINLNNQFQINLKDKIIWLFYDCIYITFLSYRLFYYIFRQTWINCIESACCYS